MKNYTHVLARIVLSVDVVFAIVLIQYDDLEHGSDLSGISTAVILVGSITSRCSGNEPEQRPDSRERRKSSLCF